jgi:hypothetical protein
LRLGLSSTKRAQLSVAAALATALVVFGATRVTASWDTSESRRNSFTKSEEAALAAIDGDLRIEAHFAPEDPRRSDLEYNAFRKLRRAVPDARIVYVSATSVGLFEQTADHYGEIQYELAGKTEVSRITTADGVLKSVLTLAGISPPAELDAEIFRGHPLAARPRNAAAIYYGAWPLAVAGIAIMIQRRKQ